MSAGADGFSQGERLHDAEQGVGMIAARVRHNSLGVHLLALGSYLLLSLAVTYPMVTQFASAQMGEHPYDRVQNTWNLWWVKVALLDRHQLPFSTDLLFYPQGADLYYHTLNLPSTLMTLVPLLLWGPIAAYNSSVLLALVLSGYAGFRLVRYVTGSNVAALLGGIIIGFNPLTQEMSRGQINVISLQWFLLCIEFYLRAWAGGRRRDAALTGLFFALALLTVAYFEVNLLVFFAIHLAWAFATGPGAGWRARTVAWARRAGPLAAWAGGVALLLAGPYALGAWLSLQGGVVIAHSADDLERNILDSLDLLSYTLPDRDHWLFGGQMPWWNFLYTNIRDRADLGVTATGLALVAVWLRRRVATTWLWVAVGLVGMILALGPVLQINGLRTIPLPFALLQYLPPLSLVRAPERFVTLTFTALAVLAAWGMMDVGQWLLDRRTKRSVQNTASSLPTSQNPKSKIQNPVAALVLAGLLIEMPLHQREMNAMPIPASMAALRAEREPGAVLELPLTQHGWLDAYHMYYQLGHGRPITGGYLSRPIIDPYTQACSPFQMFSIYPHTEATDIVSPTVQTQLSPALLAQNGIGYLAVYKQTYNNSRYHTPLPPDLLASLQATAAQVGTPLADDATATTYRLQTGGTPPGLFLQLGPDWHAQEQSGGAPFRWVNGAQADVCVFSPQAQTAPLVFSATSFHTPRRLEVWVGAQQVFAVQVPADGTLHLYQTPALPWPATPQRVRLLMPEGSASPQSLGQGSDSRQLSLGFSAIHLGAGGP